MTSKAETVAMLQVGQEICHKDRCPHPECKANDHCHMAALKADYEAATAQAAKAEAALRELVRLKNLIDSIPDHWQLTEINRHHEHGPNYYEYKSKKGAAWAAARAIVEKKDAK